MNLLQLLQLAGGPAMWILYGLSAIALALILERSIYLHRAQIRTTDFLRGLFNVLGDDRPVSAAKVIEAISICDQTEAPVARMMRAAILSWDQGAASVRKAMEEAGRAEVPRLERYIALLLSLGQAAPVAGLLGTVLGMISLLVQMDQNASQTFSGSNASGLATAFISTAFGLLVALMAYMGHNFLVTRVESLLLDMERACSDVEKRLLRPSSGGQIG